MPVFRLSRRHFVVRAAVALLAIGPWLAPAWATDASIAPPAIRQALQAAWQQHPSYRATEAQLAAARAHLTAAGQPLYNPELELSSDDEGADRTTSAGLNLTLFSCLKFASAVKTALDPSVEKSSVGLAFNVGADVPMGDGWLLNFDVKKVQIRTDVSSFGTKVGSFKVDPLAVSVGFGKRF